MFILLEALERFLERPHPPALDRPDLVLIVGGLGMLVNLIGMVMFCGHAHGGHGHSHGGGHGHSHGDKENEEKKGKHGHSHSKKKKKKSLNLAGVFLHITGDFLGSIAVIISATLSLFFDPEVHTWVTYIDPSVSSLMAIIILFTSIPLGE
jgi:zinc transporter 1